VVDREVKRSSQRIRQNVRSLNESIRRMNVTINQIGNLNRRWSTIRRLR
jgi:hypothetical protein